MALNVNTPGSDEQVKPRDDFGGVLDSFVDICHFSTSSGIILEVVLQF